jgi:hypothetical protein
LLLTFGLVTAFCAAHAQTGKWPEKPVRINQLAVTANGTCPLQTDG